MRVLMISLDKKIVERDSAAQKRHFEYGRICRGLDIIVLHSVSGVDSCPCLSVRQVKGGASGNVCIYEIRGKNKISRFFKACALAGKIVKKNKIDLVTTQDAAYTGLIGYCLKKKFKIRLNVQIHGLEEKFINKILFLSLKRKIIKSADSVRVVSERMRKRVVDKYGVDEGKIFVVPIYTEYESGIKNHESGIKNQELGLNTPFTPCLRPPAQAGRHALKGGTKKDDFTILTVGRLVKVKNIKLQITAMADVIKIFPDTKLIIVGDGSEKKNLHRLAKKLRLKDKMIFAGWQENLKPYYNNADLFLLTSNSEGWGMAVIEAMASGAPVVMTDAGCAGEVVKNDENGIVIPIGDKKALIVAICEMITNKEKRKLFAEKGLETISKLPDKKETFEMYKKMWNC